MSGQTVDDRKESALSLCSESFDPEACLRVAQISDVYMPFPNVERLKTIRACDSLVPPSAREEVAAAYGIKPKEKTEEEKQRAAEKKAFVCQRAAEYAQTVAAAVTYDPILTIVKRVRKGPLMLLRRAYQAGSDIDILTRHATGIRGVMRAKLHGFDKFMNLLLADVREWFVTRHRVVRVRSTPAPAKADSQGEHAAGTGEGVGTEGVVTKTRRGWQQALRQRQLSRVMLRGDQVVLITLADGPLQLPFALRQRFQTECANLE